MAWMAPEVLKENQYERPADIYSYGIVIWEMMTYLKPEMPEGFYLESS